MMCKLEFILCRFLLTSLTLTGLILGPCRAQTPLASKPLELVLPTALPSGNAINDRILFAFYRPNQPAFKTAPAIVLLHYIGTVTNKPMHSYGRYLAERNIAAAVVTLPYHMGRLPRGDAPVRHFVSSNADVTVQAFKQSVADVSSIITWLSQQPGIDAQRISVVGVSLGAIVTHLVMGQDERISAGVALLGGGKLIEGYQRSFAAKLFVKQKISTLNPAAIEKLRSVDPITYADRNRPRRVLMVQAARDLFIPPQTAEALWEALGRPPIQWVDVNHIGLALATRSMMKTATAYLEAVWNGNADASAIPRMRVPTLKAGMVMGLDSVITPAIQWQVYALGTRRHMSLLHADLGWSGRGPFVGVAATINAFVDIGLARRFNGNKVRPYASMHVVF